MIDFPESWRLEIGTYVDDLVRWLMDTFEFLFDFIESLVLDSLTLIQDVLLGVPWWIWIFLIFLSGWWLRKLSIGILFAVLLFIIGCFGLWEQMMQTLSIVLTAVLISLILGIPLGILMAYSKKFEWFMKPILDAMQTMPSFVYLIPAMMFFGLGMVPGVFATLIYAIPPIIRLTNLAIRGVSKEMIEAAQSFGTPRWQLLTKIQLPQAMPTIMTGVNQTTMMALAMVVIASMVGTKGLGFEVLKAINQIDIAKGFEVGISIVFLAIIIDRMTIGIANRFKIEKK